MRCCRGWELQMFLQEWRVKTVVQIETRTIQRLCVCPFVLESSSSP